MGTGNGKFVSYLRVSTKRQEESGLGVEAQRREVERFLNGGDWHHVDEFVEVESGREDDRPELKRALATCEVHGATLVVARLDRLSRRAAFILRLIDEADVPVVCCDAPNMDWTMTGVTAVFGEHERELISKRTREALAAAKARGVELGNDNLSDVPAEELREGRTPPAEVRAMGRRAAAEKRRERGQRHAENLRPTVEGIVERLGAKVTFRNVGDALRSEGIPTTPGGSNTKWNPGTVARLLDRLGIDLKARKEAAKEAAAA